MTDDPTSTIHGLSSSRTGLFRQLTVNHPDHAQVLVDEVLMPVMTNHFSDLVAIWATAYAAALRVESLKAAVAFYDSAAGRELLRAQPQLAQARFTGMTEWMSSLKLELRVRIQQTQEAHGWDKD